MVDSVVTGTFFCQFILSRQIDGDEPWQLVGGMDQSGGWDGSRTFSFPPKTGGKLCCIYAGWSVHGWNTPDWTSLSAQRCLFIIFDLV